MGATTYNKGWGEGAWGFNGFGGIAPAYAIDDGVAGTGAVGTVALVYDSNIPVSGVEGTGAVGAAGIAVSETITPAGVTATGFVGLVRIGRWTTIDDSQTPNWTNVTDSQSPGWVDVDKAA